MGLSIESPNPSSALEWFTKSIPVMVSDLGLALSTLLRLLPSDPQITSSHTSGPSNPLFDEDPINEYAEDVVIIQHITSCLKDTQRRHKQEFPVLDHLMADCLELNIELTASGGDKKSPIDRYNGMSVWDNPQLFMAVVRRHFLHRVLRTTADFTAGTEEHTIYAPIHPIFM